MSANHGYSNLKAQGRPNYQTIHQTGSSKTAQNVILKSVSEVTAIPVAIVSVVVSNDSKELTIEVTGHGAKVGNILRIDSGVCQTFEYDIIGVPDANHVVVQNVMEAIPAAADTATVLFFATLQTDAQGNLQVASGPTQFIQDAAVTQVTEDSAVPANNKPLPTGLYFFKDGVAIPVSKDTITPANTAAIPVEVTGASGPINITAGDLNVQLSDAGVNFDATRIGDGSGIYLLINADGSINVNDAAVLAKLTELEVLITALNAKDFATEATLALIKLGIDAIEATDFATEVTLAKIEAKTIASLTPVVAFDEIVTTYVGATTDIDTVTYKAAGVTVGTLTMTYDGSLRLTNVVRT